MEVGASGASGSHSSRGTMADKKDSEVMSGNEMFAQGSFDHVVLKGSVNDYKDMFRSASEEQRLEMMHRAYNLYAYYANQWRDRPTLRISRVMSDWFQIVFGDSDYDMAVPLFHLETREKIWHVMRHGTAEEYRRITKFRFNFSHIIAAWHDAYDCARHASHLRTLRERLNAHRTAIERLFLVDFGGDTVANKDLLASLSVYHTAMMGLKGVSERFVGVVLRDIEKGGTQRPESAATIRKLGDEVVQALADTQRWSVGFIPVDEH